MISTAQISAVPGATRFPQPVGARRTSRGDRGRALSVLASKKDAWVSLPIPERIALIEASLAQLRTVGDEWVAVGTQSKRSKGAESALAEEWFVYGAVGVFLHRLAQSLRDIKAEGHPRVPGGFGRTRSGRLRARSVPGGIIDRIIQPGITIDVWMRDGATEESVSATQAAAYREENRPGRVSLVLGAGNVAHLPAVDILSKLFCDLEVVICKLNPVNETIGPIYERIFAPFVDAGFLRFTYGDGSVGAELVDATEVDTIALTGSKDTYDAIVFGRGEEGQRRREAGERLCAKPFTAELGNVSPLIVVPGDWSPKEIRIQAEQLAGWQTLVGGYACMTPRVLVTQREWPLREAFLEEYARALAAIPTRYPYYPGTLGRIASFRNTYGDKYHVLGDPEPDHVPWGFIRDVDLDADSSLCLQQESFCGVISNVSLTCPDRTEFLETAAEFCNTKLFGTLVALIVVDPRTEKELADELDACIEKLDYGTVVVNLYAGQGHALACAPWGGAPGRSAIDPESGIGFNNDPYMFADPLKTVMRAPFNKLYDPASPRTNLRGPFGKAFGMYGANPSLWNLNRVGLIIAAALLRPW